MSYTASILPFVKRQISSWGLSEYALVEVYLRLKEHLPADPRGLLAPNNEERGGMIYHFSFVDPENRLREHSFAFRVFFSQDETKLIVASGVYRLDIA